MRKLRIAVIIIFIGAAALFAAYQVRTRIEADTEPPVITSDREVLEIPCGYTQEQLMEGLSAEDGTDGDLTPEIVYRWLGKGYAVQINKGSFMGRFGRTAQRTAFELLDHNLVTVVASDAHSPYQRTPWMQDVYQTLLEEYPRDYLEALFTENPGRICRGQEVIRFRRISFQDTYQI